MLGDLPAGRTSLLLRSEISTSYTAFFSGHGHFHEAFHAGTSSRPCPRAQLEGLTAQQQPLASVWKQLMPDGGQASAHGSAQVTRVAEGPHRQALQVHRLDQVGQERPLQAKHAPPRTQTDLSERSLGRNSTNSDLNFSRSTFRSACKHSRVFLFQSPLTKTHRTT